MCNLQFTDWLFFSIFCGGKNGAKSRKRGKNGAKKGGGIVACCSR